MKPKILIVDDEKPLRDTLAKWLKPSYDCLTAPDAEAALKVIAAEPELALLISDVRMPGEDGVELVRKAKKLNPVLPCILLTAYGTVDLAVEAMRDGADDFFQKPITDLNAFEKRVARSLRISSAEKAELEDFTGTSPAMAHVYALIRKVAPANANVLVEGPSGTGKELVARALHRLSPRAVGPFIAVECSALAKDLLEAELFGYAPGSFTGALKEGKRGCFEAADGGTLFLDEIGEIDPGTQVKLLRALESRTITPIGSTESRRVDFRLVAATNKNLAALVAAGDFREDLYYRLNVIDIHMPALKDRPGDVALLAERFRREFSVVYGGAVTGIEPAALAALEKYSWPGNVRQLRNTIERMVVLAAGPILTLKDVPAELLVEPPPAAPAADPSAAKASAAAAGETLADLEKAQILNALAANGNNKSRTAAALGISRRTLHRKLQEWKVR